MASANTINKTYHTPPSDIPVLIVLALAFVMIIAFMYRNSSASNAHSADFADSNTCAYVELRSPLISAYSALQHTTRYRITMTTEQQAIFPQRDDLVEQFAYATGASTKKSEKAVDKYLTEAVKQYLRFCVLDTHSDNARHCYFKSSDLTNKLGTITVKGKRYWIWSVVQKLPSCPMTLIHTGNNITGKLSVYKVTKEFEDYAYAAGDFTEYMAAVVSSLELPDNPEVDAIPVDLTNLKAFINGLEAKIDLVMDEEDPRLPQWTNQLREARRFYMMAHVTHEDTGIAMIPHFVNESPFGRKYYKGPNLQNVSKVVRHAALGHCYAIDINSCMHTWRYSTSTQLNGGKTMAFHLYDYLERAEVIRQDLAMQVFGSVEPWQTKLIKKVINAIAMGARTRAGSYYKDGKLVTFALSDIIRSKGYLDTLLDTKWMKGYIAEQEEINELILNDTLSSMTIDEIRSLNTKLVDSRNKVNTTMLISYLYQHYERELIDLMEQVINDTPENQVLLRVHDCIYVKNMFGVSDMRYALQQVDPLLKVSVTEIYKVRHVPDEEDRLLEMEHKAHIRREEEMVRQAMSFKQDELQLYTNECIEKAVKHPEDYNQIKTELMEHLGLSQNSGVQLDWIVDFANSEVERFDNTLLTRLEATAPYN